MDLISATIMNRDNLSGSYHHCRNHLIRAILQIDLVQGMMDCLYAECKPCITDCVMAELEKLGQTYRVALKVAKVSFGIKLKCGLSSFKLSDQCDDSLSKLQWCLHIWAWNVLPQLKLQILEDCIFLSRCSDWILRWHMAFNLLLQNPPPSPPSSPSQPSSASIAKHWYANCPCLGSTFGASPLHTQGDLRRWLSMWESSSAQVLHCGYVWSGSETEDPKGKPIHMYELCFAVERLI